jgi:hypothetical protein
MQQLLIESVVASDARDLNNIYYSVTAVLGPYDITWTDFWGKLLATQQQASAINVGTSQSVNILEQFTATDIATANANITVIACPVPSSTLFPSLTLFPC